MNDNQLRTGDEIQCPTCRRWHQVHHGATEVPAHLHSRAMLHFTCRGTEYLAGHEGSPTRHPFRKATAPAPHASA
jgi:hypothetical protein